MNDFIIRQKNNIWYGSFPELEAAGFINACSCRLHGESSLVDGTLNLALHVGDDQAKVIANRRAFAAVMGCGFFLGVGGKSCKKGTAILQIKAGRHTLDVPPVMWYNKIYELDLARSSSTDFLK